MPQRRKIVIRYLGLAGLLAAVFWAVDSDAVRQLLANADWRLMLACLALVQCQIVLSAMRWRFTAMRLGHAIPAGWAIGEYFLASLLNLVLPGGIGGDALRALRTTNAHDDAPLVTGPAVVRAIVLERLAGQVALAAIAVAGLIALPGLVGGDLLGGAFATIAAPLALLAGIALVAIGLSRFGRGWTQRWFGGLRRDVHLAWFAGHAWCVQGALSLAIASLYIAVFALASAAIGAPLSVMAAISLVPLVLLTMLLPVSVGGFGLREGAAASLWPLAGFTAAEGLAAALLYGLLSIAGALPGLVWLARERRLFPTSRA